MQVLIQIEVQKVEKVSELSCYNHNVYRFKYHQESGITHFVEIFDDVSSEPEYEFGIIKNDKFTPLYCGYGDEMPDSLTSGGVYVEVTLYNQPRLF